MKWIGINWVSKMSSKDGCTFHFNNVSMWVWTCIYHCKRSELNSHYLTTLNLNHNLNHSLSLSLNLNNSHNHNLNSHNNPKLAYEPLFFSLFLLLDKGCLSKLQTDPTCSSRSNNLQMSMWNCIFLLILDYTNNSNYN